MPSQPLPEKYRRFYNVDTVEEMWEQLLTEGNVYSRRFRSVYGRLPANPRCRNCHRPFDGIGGVVLRVFQRVKKAEKNPLYCEGCYSFTSQFPGGAEVELTMLFVDVRGSTRIAEKMGAYEFSLLMNRFYDAVINVLIHADAFIDKLVGDEVTALFIPGYAGPNHARKAVEAGRSMLRVTGHGKHEDPWVPVGIGIHTGSAWVGSIQGASGEAADFTALGDNVNIAARLTSSAGPGEILISENTYAAAGLGEELLERRELALKGKSNSVAVRVITG